MTSLLTQTLGFDSQWFDLPGLRLHAAVAGPANGPLVLLLHGFPDFWYGWRHHLRALAEAGYRVIAPDQRGYNLTDKTPPYDVFTLSTDMANLIQVCGHEQAYVAGHDWGGAVAWMLAATRPERVRKLAIINVPHPYVMSKALRGGNWRQLRRSWYMFYFQIPFLPEWGIGFNHFAANKRALQKSARPGTFSAEDFSHYEAAWTQPGAFTAMLGWYRAMMRGSLRPEVLRRLKQRITVPTLLLWGDRDAFIGVESAEKSLAMVDEGQLIHFPTATHWVLLEEPAATTEHLLAHFK